MLAVEADVCKQRRSINSRLVNQGKYDRVIRFVKCQLSKIKCMVIKYKGYGGLPHLIYGLRPNNLLPLCYILTPPKVHVTLMLVVRFKGLFITIGIYKYF